MGHIIWHDFRPGQLDYASYEPQNYVYRRSSFQRSLNVIKIGFIALMALSLGLVAVSLWLLIWSVM